MKTNKIIITGILIVVAIGAVCIVSILVGPEEYIAPKKTNSEHKFGIYTQKPLPEGFTYKVVSINKENTDTKNQLLIEISQKISVEQIATLAEEIVNSMPRRPRFFISYLISGMKNGDGYWAVSHINPDLEIKILGTTIQEDIIMKRVCDSLSFVAIGIWKTQATPANWVLYKKGRSIMMRQIFKGGNYFDSAMKYENKNGKMIYSYKDGGSAGEYFLINKDRELEFYNKEGIYFETGSVIN